MRKFLYEDIVQFRNSIQKLHSLKTALSRAICLMNVRAAKCLTRLKRELEFFFLAKVAAPGIPLKDDRMSIMKNRR